MFGINKKRGRCQLESRQRFSEQLYFTFEVLNLPLSVLIKDHFLFTSTYSIHWKMQNWDQIKWSIFNILTSEHTDN